MNWKVLMILCLASMAGAVSGKYAADQWHKLHSETATITFKGAYTFEGDGNPYMRCQLLKTNVATELICAWVPEEGK